MLSKEFLRPPPEIKVVDSLDYINAARKADQIGHLGEVEDIVREICLEMFKIPGVSTVFSCVGTKVHESWGEKRWNYDRPHIIVSRGENEFKFDQDTLDKFVGSYSHHEFYKHLAVRCHEERVPFKFTWYDSADARLNAVIKQPIMTVNIEHTAEQMLGYWDKLMQFTKEFQEMHGFTETCYYNLFDLPAKVTEEDVLSFFTPGKRLSWKEIAPDLGIGGHDCDFFCDYLTTKGKLVLHERPERWEKKYEMVG
ncbi:hypothetical protein HN695_00070 [Candidatus Woesearchaeota archaeon]|nr:hypothetical protein [Candidatus Woesearchaeota archaeon]